MPTEHELTKTERQVRNILTAAWSARRPSVVSPIVPKADLELILFGLGMMIFGCFLGIAAALPYLGDSVFREIYVISAFVSVIVGTFSLAKACRRPKPPAAVSVHPIRLAVPHSSRHEPGQ